VWLVPLCALAVGQLAAVRLIAVIGTTAKLS
jgi:hypothetical protein